MEIKGRLRRYPIEEEDISAVLVDLRKGEMREIINPCGLRVLYSNVSLLCLGACAILITSIDFI